MRIKHLINYSGGLCSWATAMRVIDRHGRDGVVCVFADTGIEDEDLYRFLDDTEKQLGLPMIRLKEGRTPWELFNDRKYLSNSKTAMCSIYLKREVLNIFCEEHCTSETVHHFGIDWTEIHRLERLQAKRPNQDIRAYMTEPPYLSKTDMAAWSVSEGIQPPRMYAMGFPHNNCGGFCVKAGQANFRLLLEHFPCRYLAHEAEENKIRERLNKDVSIMKDRAGGTTKPLTMQAFRERIERDGDLFDRFDYGGCGCVIDMEETQGAAINDAIMHADLMLDAIKRREEGNNDN